MDLHFFHPDVLKHCTLHIVNLTLLGISSGGALWLGSQEVAPHIFG